MEKHSELLLFSSESDHTGQRMGTSLRPCTLTRQQRKADTQATTCARHCPKCHAQGKNFTQCLQTKIYTQIHTRQNRSRCKWGTATCVMVSELHHFWPLLLSLLKGRHRDSNSTDRDPVFPAGFRVGTRLRSGQWNLTRSFWERLFSFIKNDTCYCYICKGCSHLLPMKAASWRTDRSIHQEGRIKKVEQTVELSDALIKAELLN